MARINWQAYLQEYEDNPEKFPNKRAFAKSKELNYEQVAKGLNRAKAKRETFLKEGKEDKEKLDNVGQKAGHNVGQSKELDKVGQNPPPATIESETKTYQETKGDVEGVERGKIDAPTGQTLKASQDARKQLTAQQEKFVDGVVEGKTKTQAAIDAGYKSKHIGSFASHVSLTTNVANAISTSRAHMREQVGITHAQLADTLAQISLVGLKDIMEVDATGMITFKKGVDLSGFMGNAINKIKTKRKVRQTEFGEEVEVEMEIGGHDRIKAISTLSKMLGYEDPKMYNSIMSKDKTVRAIWAKFTSGKCTAQDAYNYFDLYGIEVPQSIVDQAKAEYKIVLEENEGSMAEGLDYDALEARWNAYQAKLKEEKEQFKPAREAELEKIREEYEKKNINESNMGDDRKKDGKEVGKEKPS